MKTISVTDLQHATAHYLELAAEEDVIILKDGKPLGVLRGLTEADDLFDYQLEAHPLFIERVRRARKEYLLGKSERLDAIRDELLSAPDPE
ncbi:type II toxin-antitoxin system Phd/YefM family antitoxin [Candidatus Chloroploca sp. Khr17]|uniref:type II toxin-antitoxin system Phd/YefM family antitoxin n=1 Tax=Candidatus Chloroploca sp. Khr17 TaxID=2496869 RepID=UPI00101C21EC|nr:prevent-host-death protein [Candidatus Chloroploca sp. Khr17]